MATGIIEVHTSDGRSRVRAEIAGGVAVHRALGDDVKGYTVTHVASGYALQRAIDTKRAALALAGMLRDADIPGMGDAAPEREALKAMADVVRRWAYGRWGMVPPEHREAGVA